MTLARTSIARTSIAVALAGLFALGTVPAVSAAPLPSAQEPGKPADIAAALSAVDSGQAAFVPVQARNNVVIRRGGGTYRGGGAYRGGAYRGGGVVYNPGFYRNGVYHSSNAYRGGNRYVRPYPNRWAYDQRYHGPRYGYRRPGYGYYHGGYWYSNPWWATGAGLAVGALAGAAIGAATHPAPVGTDHVAWCQNRYRSYDVRTNTFVGYDGIRRECVGP
jgi:hypothetical protein